MYMSTPLTYESILSKFEEVEILLKNKVIEPINIQCSILSNYKRCFECVEVELIK